MTRRSPSKATWNATERDFAILADIGEHGILDTRMIHRRHWPTETDIRACQKRMATLKKQGLVDLASLTVTRKADVKKSVKKAPFGGSLPNAFVLTPSGAAVLLEHTGETARRISRSEPSAVMLLHRLAVVAGRLAFDEAATNAGLLRPKWILEQDCVPNPRLKQPAEERHLLYERFSVSDGDDIWSRPDASSLLQQQKGTEAAPRFLVIYWEFDRSNNGLDRERAKALGYDCLLRNQVYRRHWPCLVEQEPDAFRVFYVCESEKRIQELCAGMADLDITAYYRFAIKDQVESPAVLTEPIWRDTLGRRYAILRRAN